MKRFMLKFVVAMMAVVVMTGSVFAGALDTPTVYPEMTMSVQLMSQDDSDLSKDSQKILSIAEKANDDISKEIDKAIDKAEKAKKDKQIDKIIEKLVDKTSKITEKAIKKINKLGGEAICIYMEVEIAGRTVLVDPIRIVRL